jgi:PAS domain S-box-containing protein
MTGSFRAFLGAMLLILITPTSCRRGRRLVQGLGIFLVAWASVASAEPKRVLIVHSFGSASPPFTTHSVAFETELTEKLGERVDLDEISLDEARYESSDMKDALVDYIQKRLTKWRPDLVVPIGSPACVFVAQNRERLFPKTPVLYTATDKRRLPEGALQKNATFVGEDFNVPGFVEDILQVAPATTNIAVVIGASPLERYWKAAFRREFERFTNRVAFTWFDDLSFDQMLERVSKLPPRSFIFVALLHQDAAGVTLNANEALKQIHGAANAPVNGIFQYQLGLGIVGGRLYQAELEGVESAHMAIRILHGEPASAISNKIVGSLPPQYDWRELQRWKINEANLPAGSLIKFRQPTIWQQYRWHAAGILVFCGLQTVLIIGLVANKLARKRADRELRESEERLTLAAEAAEFGVWVWNVTSNQMWGSEIWRQLFGFASGENIGFEKLYARIHREDRETFEQEIKCAAADQIDHLREYRIILPDGTQRWVASRGRMRQDANGKDFRMFGVAIEITGRKQTEIAMHDLSRRLIRAHEAERARLGRELHDDVTQRLAILAIDAGRVEHGMDKVLAAETMRGIREGLVRLSEDIHALSYRLHPALLEDLGLAEALKAECERFTRQESVPVEVAVLDLPENVSPDAALCLFRVTQEALRNVARHAKASRVEVSLRVFSLRTLNDNLQLVVHDDGIGFDPILPRARPSLGLESMRERVFLVDGQLHIESTPNQGTTIRVTVPLKKSEGQNE